MILLPDDSLALLFLSLKTHIVSRFDGDDPATATADLWWKPTADDAQEQKSNAEKIEIRFTIVDS
jgi:hypothetical protein